MTAVLEAPALECLTDEQLAAAWSAADVDEPATFAAFMAEFGKRERPEQAARAQEARDARRKDAEAALRSEWYDAMHAQRMAAEAFCGGGGMLNHEGLARKVSEWDMWTGPWALVEKYGSEDLLWFFGHKSPRMTWTEFRRQLARAGRIQREEWRDREDITSKGADDHDHDHGGPGLARDDAGALRHVEAAPQAPQAGPGGTVRRAGPAPAAAGDGRDAGRPGRPVQPASGRVSQLTAVIEDHTAPMDARVDAYYQRAGVAPAPRRAPAEVAVPQPMAVARTAEPVDGARLLNIADAWMARHVHMPDHARHAAVLYVAAQHFRLAESGRLAWPRFGRMLYVADAPGSGKTTAMLLMGLMSAPWFQGIDANPTAPGLCASIRDERAALFIDEFHRLLGAKGTRKADVVTILNVGYEKNGTYLNARGGKANREPVYAPAVMAGKDTLITSASEEIADLLDRCCAIVHMQRPPDDVDLAEVTDATEAQGAAVGAKMAQWAAEQMAGPERFREAFTAACDRAKDMGLTGRAKDVWVPLLAAGWLASPGHMDAAAQAAVEFRRKPHGVRQQEEDDPLAGLEAELAGGGDLPSWG